MGIGEPAYLRFDLTSLLQRRDDPASSRDQALCLPIVALSMIMARGRQGRNRIALRKTANDVTLRSSSQPSDLRQSAREWEGTMASQALYLKWRSQTFEEVIGQNHVTQTLRNALERDRIAHAYLLCGPRGTGKTSTARILAKAVNCTSEDAQRPCNQCAICLAVNDGTLMDLVEVDAASNTGVDDVRGIRDKIRFRPNQARYKVYVIDEVHMLSPQAFNALLKTLEEPPPHVIFVLATTEPHRIPATVISRCQRFDFRYVPTSDIAAHLSRMADAEGMRIEPDAVELIAAHAGGAVRDAVTLLDQLAAYGGEGITVTHVQNILGVGSIDMVADLVDALIRRQSGAGLAVIDRLVDQGSELRQFNTEFIEYVRGMLLINAGGSPRLLHLDPDARRRLREQAAQLELGDLVRYARLFSVAAQGLKSSLQPQLPLELAFLEAVSGDTQARGSQPAIRSVGGQPAGARSSDSVSTSDPPPPERSSGGTQQAEREGKPAAQRPANRTVAPDTSAAPVQDGSGLATTIEERWQDILRVVRSADKNAEAFLRSAMPADAEGASFVIQFKHAFHKDKFESTGGEVILGDAIHQVTGQRVQIRCQLVGKTGVKPAGRTRSQPRNDEASAPKSPEGVANSSSRPKGSSTRETDTTPPAVADGDQVLKALTDMGGRILKVVPPDGSLDGPPLPEEPPPIEVM